MSAPTCICGQQSHEDQREKYPVGTRIRFMPNYELGEFGVVVDHCNDGRAVILPDNCNDVHTFHYLNSYVASIVSPQPPAQPSSEYVQQWEVTSTDDLLVMLGKANQRIAELTSQVETLTMQLQRAASSAWEPLIEDEDLDLRRLQSEKDGFLSSMYCGTAFFTDQDEDARFLPPGYAICREVR